MPRTSLSHARCFASPELPLLPFLAPRVFAEAAVGSHGPTRRNTPSAITYKDENKKTLKAHPGKHFSWSYLVDAQDTTRIHGSDFHLATGGPEAQCSLLASTSSSPRRSTRLSPTRTNGMANRYAHIFSFVHSHYRSFATGVPARRELAPTASVSRVRRVRQELPSNLASTHKKEPPLMRRQNPTKPSSSPNLTSSAGSASAPPTQYQKRPTARAVLDIRRRKAFRRALEQFKHIGDRFPKSRASVKNGTYRSLRRRLNSYGRLHAHILDLSEINGQSKRKTLLLHGFSALDRRVYPGMARTSHYMGIKHDPRCQAWIEELYTAGDTTTETQLMDNWLSIPERDTHWHLMLFYVLDKSIYRAQMLLRVLALAPPTDINYFPEFLADSFGHLARVYRKQKDTSQVVPNEAAFVPTFFAAMKSWLRRHPDLCSQDLYYLMASLSSVDDLTRLFRFLSQELKVDIQTNTYLQWSNIFSAGGEHEYALQCLNLAAWRGNKGDYNKDVANSTIFKYSCALALRASVVHGKDYHGTTRIVGEFLNMGTKLDILLYNVIIHNAVDAGDLATAFKVYNLLEENGVKADKFTYAFLLTGCTTVEDVGKYNDFAEHCVDMALKFKDPWLAAGYLYYLYTRHTKEGLDHQSLTLILSRAYAHFFTKGPLEHFGYYPGSSGDHVAFGKLSPPPLAIYVMLQMQINIALEESNVRVWNLYKRFSELERSGKFPVLAQMAKTDHVYNAFLHAFAKNRQFANASQLLTDMSEPSRPPGAVPPSITSWTIFMHAFFMDKQYLAGQRVFDIIRSRDIKPDQVASNVLLAGYAHAQMPEAVGEVMLNLPSQGELDPQVLKALARIIDRGRLMRVLEKTKKHVDTDQRLAYEKKAEEEKQRWSLEAFPDHAPNDQPPSLRESVETSASKAGLKSSVRNNADTPVPKVPSLPEHATRERAVGILEDSVQDYSALRITNAALEPTKAKDKFTIQSVAQQELTQEDHDQAKPWKPSQEEQAQTQIIQRMTEEEIPARQEPDIEASPKSDFHSPSSPYNSFLDSTQPTIEPTTETQTQSPGSMQSKPPAPLAQQAIHADTPTKWTLKLPLLSPRPSFLASRQQSLRASQPVENQHSKVKRKAQGEKRAARKSQSTMLDWYEHRARKAIYAPSEPMSRRPLLVRTEQERAEQKALAHEARERRKSRIKDMLEEEGRAKVEAHGRNTSEVVAKGQDAAGSASIDVEAEDKATQA